MKLLFLTTYGVRIINEHFFTKNVIKHLGIYSQSHDDFEMGCITLLPSNDISESILTDTPELGAEFGVNYKIFQYPNSWPIDKRETSAISAHCYKCIISDLPFPKFGLAAYRMFNATKIAYYFANRKNPVWYWTTLFRTDNRVIERQECINDFKYAHVIAANHKLGALLEKYVPANQIHVIPHGVEARKRLPLPSLDGPIHFFLLSRIQYSKGIIEALEAFRGIPHSQYQLHIIGDAERSLSDRIYMKKVLIAARGINVAFHGRLPNTDIETVIDKCHIMIHNTFSLEIFGINMSEVLSMGRGILASKCGGAEMQIEDGKNGILYEPHSVSALHDAILNVLNNKDLIRQFSESAKLPMPIENYVNNLVALYHEVSRI